MGERLHFLLDMDGVLADFLSAALKALNKRYSKTVTLKEYAERFGKWETYDFYGIPEKDFWNTIYNTPDFWLDIEPIPWASDLYLTLKARGHVTIVTSPSDDPDCARQKLQWLDMYFGIKPPEVFVGSRKYLMAGKGILIDDYSKNVEAFQEAGGEAILVPSVWNCNTIDFETVWSFISNYLDTRKPKEVSEDGRIIFSTGMMRDGNNDKPRFDLICPLDLPFEAQMLTRWARLMARGAAHYSERNWEKAKTEEEFARFRESAFRHFAQWFFNEGTEDHAAAVFFNITGAEMVKYKAEPFGNNK